MASTQYGVAKHYLKDTALRPTLTPKNCTLGTHYGSPLVTDCRTSPGGTIKEFIGSDGLINAFEVSGEYVDVTITIMPEGTTKALALLATHVFRKGHPFTLSNFPVIKLLGHAAAGAATIEDVLNGVLFLQSDDRTMSLEGETGGTMTFRRYIAAVSDTIIA